MNDDSKIQRYTFNIYNKIGNCSVSNTRQNAILDNTKNYRVAIEGFVLKSSQNFSNIVKLIFETNNIPVVQTNLSGELNYQRKQVGEYYLTKTDSDATNFYIHYRSDLYDEYDLDSNTPLTTLDLFVYKQDVTGAITAVQIDNNTGLSLTLAFIRN